MRKVISYLLNRENKLGLIVSKGGGLRLSVYVGANFADKAHERRSASGGTSYN